MRQPARPPARAAAARAALYTPPPHARSHGALLALGVLVSRAASVPEARGVLDLQAATGAILSQFLHREAAVREAAIAALASVARAGPLPLPIGDEEDGGSSPQAGITGGLSRIGVVRQLEAVALAATAAAAAAEETAQAAAAQRAGGSRAPAAAAVTLAAAAGGVAVEAAVACLGAIAAGERLAAEGTSSATASTTSDAPAPPPPTPAVMRAAMAALLRLSPNRSESVQFAVGAALVEACGGAEATGPHSLVGARSNGRANAAAPASAALDSLDAAGAGMTDAPSLPGFSGAADRSAPAAPDCSSAAAALRGACLSRVLDAVLGGPLVSVRATERAAAAVWLLALTHGLGARSPELRRRLGELHGAFMRLLGERSPFVQVRPVGRWGRGGVCWIASPHPPCLPRLSACLPPCLPHLSICLPASLRAAGGGGQGPLHRVRLRWGLGAAQPRQRPRLLLRNGQARRGRRCCARACRRLCE